MQLSIKVKQRVYILVLGKNKTPEFNKIKWTKTHVKTLGIVHGYDIDENIIWMEKINKIKGCIQVWKKTRFDYKRKDFDN